MENEIALQKLSSGHPNVVGYFDTYLTSQELWVVMEYVPGMLFPPLIFATKKRGVAFIVPYY